MGAPCLAEIPGLLHWGWMGSSSFALALENALGIPGILCGYIHKYVVQGI